MVDFWIYFLLFPSLVFSYSWHLSNAPTQCQDLTVVIEGVGSPPYQLLMVPSGPEPLPMPFQTNFTASQTTFQLPYVANQQVVMVMSDASGLASGGTSVSTVVVLGNSTDTSCVVPGSNPFTFSISPISNAIVECSPTRISWNPDLVQGTPAFLAVVPGGQTIEIPEPGLTTVSGRAGFTWTPTLRQGTTFILVGGDNRGAASGGYVEYQVSGVGATTACLTAAGVVVPSSTAGTAVGGVMTATSTSATTTTNSPSPTGSSPTSVTNSRKSNMAAVIGGVVGAVALTTILLAFLCYVVNRRRKRPEAQTVYDSQDLFREDFVSASFSSMYRAVPFADPSSLPGSPPYGYTDPYRGTPERVAYDPYYGYESHSTSPSTSPGYGSFQARQGAVPSPPTTTTTTTTRTRKGSRPIPSEEPRTSIIQHVDAGPSNTIELPPAYSHIS